jgi:hypothetical protein
MAFEPDEQFTLTLSNPVNASLDSNAKSASATIADDDNLAKIGPDKRVQEGDTSGNSVEVPVSLPRRGQKLSR